MFKLSAILCLCIACPACGPSAAEISDQQQELHERITDTNQQLRSENIRLEIDQVERSQGTDIARLLGSCLAAGYPSTPHSLSQRRIAACDKIRERQKTIEAENVKISRDRDLQTERRLVP